MSKKKKKAMHGMKGGVANARLGADSRDPGWLIKSVLIISVLILIGLVLKESSLGLDLLASVFTTLGFK
jgi:hypothetical protein